MSMERSRHPGVFKRGRKYVAVVSYRDPQGHRRQQWLTRSTATEARDAKRELEAEIGKGLRPASSKLTVGEFLAEWLEGIGKGVGRPDRIPARPLTIAKYASVVDREIVPALGRLPLRALTAEVIESWDGGRYAFTVLSSAFSWGVGRKRLQANPCKAVEPPQGPEKRKPKFLDAEERHRLLEAVRGHRLEPAVVLGLVGGLRIGEACGVRWGDLTDTGDLTVARSYWGPTKSGKERTIRLPATAAASLRAWKRRQREELLAVGVHQTAETPIVSTVVGEARAPKRLTAAFTAFARDHGFEATFHTLRHSCATWLLHAGVDVVTVAVRLGHADPGLVLRVYGHATRDSDRDAAERMQEALGK